MSKPVIVGGIVATTAYAGYKLVQWVKGIDTYLFTYLFAMIQRDYNIILVIRYHDGDDLTMFH